jgi:hypothetical protein
LNVQKIAIERANSGVRYGGAGVWLTLAAIGVISRQQSPIDDPLLTIHEISLTRKVLDSLLLIAATIVVLFVLYYHGLDGSFQSIPTL